VISIRALGGVIDDAAGKALAPSMLHMIAALDSSSLPVVLHGVRLAPCVAGVGKFSDDVHELPKTATPRRGLQWGPRVGWFIIYLLKTNTYKESVVTTRPTI
jgi:hypothetical protein